MKGFLIPSAPSSLAPFQAPASYHDAIFSHHPQPVNPTRPLVGGRTSAPDVVDVPDGSGTRDPVTIQKQTKRSMTNRIYLHGWLIFMVN